MPRDAIKKTGACLNTTTEVILVSDMSIIIKNGSNNEKFRDSLTADRSELPEESKEIAPYETGKTSKKKTSFSLPIDSNKMPKTKTNDEMTR